MRRSLLSYLPIKEREAKMRSNRAIVLLLNNCLLSLLTLYLLGLPENNVFLGI